MFSNFLSWETFCKQDLYELNKFVHEKPVPVEISLVNCRRQGRSKQKIKRLQYFIILFE
jgi:hypothetical protein